MLMLCSYAFLSSKYILIATVICLGAVFSCHPAGNDCLYRTDYVCVFLFVPFVWTSAQTYCIFRMSKGTSILPSSKDTKSTSHEYLHSLHGFQFNKEMKT